MIGWYVHHVGRGHATRAAAVASHLRTPVTGLGSGPAPPGWPGTWIALERDDQGRAQGTTMVDADVTAGGALHWVPRHDLGLAARHARLARWAAACRPELLVVDVSVEVTLLARLCGIPVAVVALPGCREDRAHVLAYDVADALLAPWPAGTHETGWPRRWREKTWTVGGISRHDGWAVPPARPRGTPRVLLLWGAGGRATSSEQVRRAREATPGWEWVERAPGSGDDVWQDLADADVVVTHGGQNAVAEVAAARRPAVVVAQPRPFDEQLATARELDRLGVAVGLQEWPEPDRWPALLTRARSLGGAGWSRWSSGSGAVLAARRLDELTDRLAAGGGAR